MVNLALIRCGFLSPRRVSSCRAEAASANAGFAYADGCSRGDFPRRWQILPSSLSTLTLSRDGNAGARSTGSGESSEDDSQLQPRPQPQPQPQPLPLWSDSSRSAVVYCALSSLLGAEGKKLLGKVSAWRGRAGKLRAAGNHRAGAVFAVPTEAQAHERREAAAMEGKLCADTISGLWGCPCWAARAGGGGVPRVPGLSRESCRSRSSRPSRSPAL